MNLVRFTAIRSPSLKRKLHFAVVERSFQTSISGIANLHSSIPSVSSIDIHALSVIRKFSSQPTDRTNPSKKMPAPDVLEKTPKGRLDDKGEERHRDAEKEPLPRWPNGKNPHTGEEGGPAGPEPTRFGDWERKGRVTDF